MHARLRVEIVVGDELRIRKWTDGLDAEGSCEHLRRSFCLYVILSVERRNFKSKSCKPWKKETQTSVAMNVLSVLPPRSQMEMQMTGQPGTAYLFTDLFTNDFICLLT